MARISDQEKQALKTKHPGEELELLAHPQYEEDAVARPPKQAEWRIFDAKRDANAEGDSAVDFLLDTCIVWPDKKGREQAFERRPGLRDSWLKQIIAITGFSAEIRRSKL